jgi:drug/metabolite transporter (DMT)-like permease
VNGGTVPLTFSVVAALAYGAADFFGGVASRKSSPALVVFASQAVGFAVLAAALALVPGQFAASDVPWGVAAGVAGALGIGFLYAALARARMGIVSPITAAVGAAVPVLFGLAAGERPGGVALAGVGCAVIAVVLVSSSPESGRFDPRGPGIGLALASGLAIGALYVLLSRGSHGSGLWLLVPTRLTSVILLGLFTFFRGSRLTATRRTYALIAVSGALDMGANVSYVFATREGMLALVAVVTSLYPAATVFLARILLNERLAAIQWTGAGFAAAGVVLIARGN